MEAVVRWRTAGLTLVVLLVVGGVGASVAIYGFLRAYGLIELPFRKRQALRIVTDVKSGQLQANRDGVAVLPLNLASTTIDGRVYATRRPGGLLLILFPLWRGKGSNLRGYLFTSRPLTGADTYLDASNSEAVDLRYRVAPTIGNDALAVQIQKTDTPNWYRASYGWD